MLRKFNRILSKRSLSHSHGALSSIPATTKCAIVDHHGDKFSIKNIPTPEPAKGQVLVKIHASGVCHTDVHAVDGDWPVNMHVLNSIALLN